MTGNGKRRPGLFITGTSSGVGKTRVAAAIARQLVGRGVHVGVYKPVLSGYSTELATSTPSELAASPDDDLLLWNAAGRPGDSARVAPQRFRAPVAPPVAARWAGTAVDRDLLREGIRYWQARSDLVLVEGAGGLMSPVSDGDYVADLAHDFAYPIVVVAPNELGVINHTLLTLMAAATYRGGLPVAGVVLNHVRPAPERDPSVLDNRRELERCSPRPVLAELAHEAHEFDPPVDWLALAELRD